MLTIPQKAMAQAPARKPWFVVFTDGAGANQATQVKAMNDLVERQSGAPSILASNRRSLPLTSCAQATSSTPS